MTHSGEAPVVIVTGLPRSGTSMMMRMLEAGGIPVLVDGIRQADADNPNGYYEFEPVKTLKQDSSWVKDAAGKAVKLVYLLLYDLPRDCRYDVIFMRRNLEEVVDSQNEMLRHQGVAVTPDESLRLVELFRRELSAVERWLTAHKNFRRLDVDYKGTVDEPRETSARIRAFLGRDLDEARMDSTIARSLYRQRREQAAGSLNQRV